MYSASESTKKIHIHHIIYKLSLKRLNNLLKVRAQIFRVTQSLVFVFAILLVVPVWNVDSSKAVVCLQRNLHQQMLELLAM